ncbi:DUF6268 family outer membrane beta-barrel protein [Kordia algicida OT-1]|uniref:DUF6268 domain-containing protein n=1 Tax=Kordia algicida OT-1 TaxID=391587 RepID=A9DPT6_9FLAO|nr:DUF6268 family outer membrane beta-barrel protein [Kordia algicida]EDP97516.1 hypothetical protein KAOT1_20177 [Kordia algicida OT-1]
MPNFARILICLFFLSATTAYAQLGDLARIDYTYIPNAKSDVEYTRFRALFNYPIKLKDNDTYLFLGLDYSNIHLRSEIEFPFDTRDLNDFQLLDFNFGYTTPLKNDWRLGIQFRPGFSTNLVADALSIKDVVLSGTVLFIRKGAEYNGKRTKLILGVSYAGNSGFNFPLPLVSYYKKFHPDWSYSIGIPKTNLQYHFTEKHRLKAYAQLDGFTSNLQRDVPIIEGKAARSINMSLILSGLQYEYYFTKNLQFYARAAYIFALNNELRDESRETLFSLDNEAKIYLRTGVKFKI